MSFLAPLFVGFIALAGVPIALHLFGKDRAPRIRFAALSLLLRNHDRIARSRKLRDRLLLLLRVLAIIAVPLLLAKPFLFAKSGLPVSIDGPQSAVIIVDDSLSMRALVGRETLFARAKSRALELTDALVDSEVAVLLAGKGSAEPSPELNYDRRSARARIAALEPSTRATDAAHAIARAAQLLEHGAHASKHIYLIGDLAAHGFTQAPPALVAGVSLHLIDVTDGAKIPNRAITALDTQLLPSDANAPADWQIDVEVANFSGEAVKDLPLTVRVDGIEISRALVELLPAQRLTRRFVHHPTSEQAAIGKSNSVTVEISHDALPDDDVMTRALAITRALHVLVIDGDPHVARRDDEVFYLETALAMRGAGPIIRTTVATADDARTRSLDDVDVIFLCNAADPPTTLDAFVRRGGGLFISLGDRVNLEDYNRRLGALLPRPFATLRISAEHADQLGVLDRAHPLLAPFSDATDQSLSGVRVTRYALLAPGGSVSAAILHESGAPLLVSQTIDKGRVVLLTTTIDRDWSTLAIAPAFLPLMQSAVVYLSGKAMSTNLAAALRDASESDLTPLLPERIAELTHATDAKKSAPERRKIPLWPTLGATLLLLLLAESLLLARR